LLVLRYFPCLDFSRFLYVITNRYTVLNPKVLFLLQFFTVRSLFVIDWLVYMQNGHLNDIRHHTWSTDFLSIDLFHCRQINVWCINYFTNLISSQCTLIHGTVSLKHSVILFAMTNTKYKRMPLFKWSLFSIYVSYSHTQLGVLLGLVTSIMLFKPL